MEKSVELLKGKKGKKWILWSVIVAVAIVAVIISVVLMTGGSKNPLKGCEFVYPISNLEEYKIVFDEETVTLHHNYYRKNSQSVSGKVKDSKKSNARTFDCKYNYEGCLEMEGFNIFYEQDPKTKDLTFRDVAFLNISKHWEFFQKLE